MRALATDSSLPNARVEDELRSIAAALTTARGRLDALASSLPEEEPEGVGEKSGRNLRAIISCIRAGALDVAIRGLVRAAGQEAAAVDHAAGHVAVGGQVYAAVIARIDRALPHLVAEHEQQQREAEELFIDLASSEGAERDAALADERFHRMLVIEKLLEEAGSALPEDPERAEEFAGLAGAIAGHLADVAEVMEGRARRLPAGECPPSRGRPRRRRAGARRSGAQPRRRRRKSRALPRTRPPALGTRAVRGSGGAPRPRRGSVGRGGSAARGGSLPRAARAPPGRGGESCRGVGLLAGELPLLADPWLTLYGGLALALGLAERGLEDRARARRDESGALVHRTPRAAHLYALREEGAIAASLGEVVAAEALFEELRLAALEDRLLPEAAVATLALVHLDVERGAAREPTRERAAALAAIFRGTEGLDAVVAVLSGLPNQLAAAESPSDLAAKRTADLLRLLRLRGVRSAPLPFL
jgi:hypothetical protein